MANINDESTETFTVASGAESGTVEINSSDNGEQATVFIDDGTGAAPGDYTLIVERYSEAEDRWMEYARSSTASASNPQSSDYDAVPSRMRFSVQNDTAGSADYRISAVSY